MNQTEIELFLRTRSASLLELPLEEIKGTHHLIDDLYMDSMKATQLAGQLGEEVGIEVDPAQFYDAGTIAQIAAQVASQVAPHAATRLALRADPLVAAIGSGADAAARRIDVVIAANFTAEPLGEALGHWLGALGMGPVLTFAPYNQILQELLNPASAVRANRGGINVLVLRVEDWFHAGGGGLREEAAERAVDDLLSALGGALVGPTSDDARGAARFILVLAAHGPAVLGDPAHAPVIARLDARILDEASALRGVSVLDLRDLEGRYRMAVVHDPARDELGHIPFSNAYYAAVGTEIARKVHALTSPQPKVIVLDCDHTLWRGVVGEDGPRGIVIDEHHAALQRFMRAQMEAGRLLCLASKNNEDDVWEAFAAHPEMPLSREHIVAARIDWRPKSENLRALADELGLALDSFIFVDDSAMECAEVSSQMPSVLCVQVPADTARIEGFFAHHWAFDLRGITDEDRGRTRMYKESARRADLERESGGSFEEFLARLELRVDIAPLDDASLQRAAQLSERTSQWNTTTRRRSEAELAILVAAPGTSAFVVRVADRFGDYGLVGLMILMRGQDEGLLVVESFLLSCRVLGRRVEHEMLRFIAGQAAATGRRRIDFQVRASKRNKPVFDFVRSWGRPLLDVGDGNGLVSFVPEEIDALLAAARAAPAAAPEDRGETAAPAKAEAASSLDGNAQPALARAGALAAIAALAGDAAAIVHEARSLRAPRPPLATAFVAARTFWQKTIAAIFCDVLRVDRVGIHDSFHDLGGSSLAAAELTTRLYAAGAGTSISLAGVLAPTVASLAEAIDATQSGRPMPRTQGAPSAAATLQREAERADHILFPRSSEGGGEGRAGSATDEPARNIFVTGASGYFGAYLLAELLTQTSARLHCHVRARSDEAGRDRIEANLRQYALWTPAFATRIEVVRGDLTQPLLGLDEARFQSLGDEIDAIYHNGAWVNFVLPYRVLEPANVRGTESVLRLAATGRDKPLHFISTLGVLMSGGYERGRVIREDDPLDHAEDLPNGYEQTKWVADKMVSRALERGLRGSIYRLGMLSGLADSGTYYKVNEFLPSFIKGCLQLGSFPDLDTRVEMVPIDFVARATVAIATRPEHLGRVYQMNHPRALHAGQIASLIRALGYPLRTVPWDVWKRELLGAGPRLRQNALYPFVNFVASLREAQTFMPEMDLSNFLGAIEHGGLECPSQETLIERYFRFFVDSKFIDAAARDALPLPALVDSATRRVGAPAVL